MGFICLVGAAACLYAVVKGKPESRKSSLILTAMFTVALLGTIGWHQSSVVPMKIAQSCDSSYAAYKAAQPVVREALRERGASSVKFITKNRDNFYRGKCRHTVSGDVQFKNARGQRLSDKFSASMVFDEKANKWTSERQVSFDLSHLH